MAATAGFLSLFLTLALDCGGAAATDLVAKVAAPVIAYRAASEQLARELGGLTELPPSKVLGIGAAFVFEIDVRVPRDSVPLEATPLPLSEADERDGIVGRFTFVPRAGLALRAKPCSRSGRPDSSGPRIDTESFPFLFPWSPSMTLAQVFAPCDIVVYSTGQIEVVTPFLPDLQALSAQDVTKLFNRDQTPFLTADGRLALLRAREIVAACFPQRHDSLFVARTCWKQSRLGPLEKIADSPNEAFEWLDRARQIPDDGGDYVPDFGGAQDSPSTKYLGDQATPMDLWEVPGPWQLWVSDGASVAPHERANGIGAKGTIRFRVRGLSRHATLFLSTSGTRERTSKAVVDEPWSAWQPRRTHAFNWEYIQDRQGMHFECKASVEEAALSTAIPRLHTGSPTLAKHEPCDRHGFRSEHLDRALKLTEHRPHTIAIETWRDLPEELTRIPRP